MKERMGFVSNSSSSSYIILFAEVTDLEKATAFITENKFPGKFITKNDFSHEFYTKKTSDGKVIYELDCDWAGVYDMSISDDMVDPDKHYFYYDKCDDFECEEEEEYYAIDLDYFDEPIVKLVNEISEENGFANIKCEFGAGYNG